jgi:hypothetical protein
MSRVAASRRYDQEAIARPASQQLPQRRALGDITNITEDTKNNAAKKPAQHVSHHAAAPVHMPSIVPVVAQMETEPADIVDDRSYMQRPSDDIDARDAGNPVLATTYVTEMYGCFSDTEKKFFIDNTYMANQPYINERMRSILIDWLVRLSNISVTIVVQ